MAQEPERIKRIFEIEEMNSAGVYAMTLYAMGIPVTVTVDDYLPFDWDFGGPYYGNKG